MNIKDHMQPWTQKTSTVVSKTVWVEIITLKPAFDHVDLGWIWEPAEVLQPGNDAIFYISYDAKSDRNSSILRKAIITDGEQYVKVNRIVDPDTFVLDTKQQHRMVLNKNIVQREIEDYVNSQLSSM